MPKPPLAHAETARIVHEDDSLLNNLGWDGQSPHSREKRLPTAEAIRETRNNKQRKGVDQFVTFSNESCLTTMSAQQGVGLLNVFCLVRGTCICVAEYSSCVTL